MSRMDILVDVAVQYGILKPGDIPRGHGLPVAQHEVKNKDALPKGIRVVPSASFFNQLVSPEDDGGRWALPVVYDLCDDIGEVLTGPPWWTRHGIFSTWWGVITPRRDRTAIDGLYYLHELTHLWAFRTLQQKSNRVTPKVRWTWAEWAAWSIRVEAFASMVSEIWIYFMAPDIRKASFGHEIFFDVNGGSAVTAMWDSLKLRSADVYPARNWLFRNLFIHRHEQRPEVPASVFESHPEHVYAVLECMRRTLQTMTEARLRSLTAPDFSCPMGRQIVNYYQANHKWVREQTIGRHSFPNGMGNGAEPRIVVPWQHTMSMWMQGLDGDGAAWTKWYMSTLTWDEVEGFERGTRYQNPPENAEDFYATSYAGIPQPYRESTAATADRYISEGAYYSNAPFTAVFDMAWFQPG